MILVCIIVTCSLNLYFSIPCAVVFPPLPCVFRWPCHPSPAKVSILRGLETYYLFLLPGQSRVIDEPFSEHTWVSGCLAHEGAFFLFVSLINIFQSQMRAKGEETKWHSKFVARGRHGWRRKDESSRMPVMCPAVIEILLHQDSKTLCKVLIDLLRRMYKQKNQCFITAAPSMLASTTWSLTVILFCRSVRPEQDFLVLLSVFQCSQWLPHHRRGFLPPHMLG